MTLEELAEMLEKTGFPFAYDHFAEGESPDPHAGQCRAYPRRHRHDCPLLLRSPRRNAKIKQKRPVFEQKAGFFSFPKTFQFLKMIPERSRKPQSEAMIWIYCVYFVKSL